MAEKNFCLLCGKTIGMWDKVCPYCGERQFGEHDEYYPTARDIRKAKRMLSQGGKKKRGKEPVFTDEEILATDLYPNDEGYRMSLISRILGKR